MLSSLKCHNRGGASLSPRPTRVKGWRRMFGCDVTVKCTRFQASFAHSDSGTISVRKHIPFNSIYCLFDSTTLSKNNFLQQFLSYIKLYSFFVVYVHYPFTPSLLLTQTLHKRISQKDFTVSYGVLKIH